MRWVRLTVLKTLVMMVILVTEELTTKEEVILPDIIYKQLGECDVCDWKDTYKCPNKDILTSSIKDCSDRLAFLKSLSSRPNPTYKQYIKDYQQYKALLVTNKDYRIMEDLEIRLEQKQRDYETANNNNNGFDYDADSIKLIKEDINNIRKAWMVARQNWENSWKMTMKPLQDDVALEMPKKIDIETRHTLSLPDIHRIMRGTESDSKLSRNDIMRGENSEKVIDGTVIED